MSVIGGFPSTMRAKLKQSHSHVKWSSNTSYGYSVLAPGSRDRLYIHHLQSHYCNHRDVLKLVKMVIRSLDNWFVFSADELF